MNKPFAYDDEDFGHELAKIVRDDHPERLGDCREDAAHTGLGNRTRTLRDVAIQRDRIKPRKLVCSRYWTIR